MSPPPKYIISRRLVANYFRKHLPKKPLQTIDVESLLFKCWEKNGVNDIQCREYEELLDFTQEQNQQYMQKIKNLRIKEDIMGTLKKPYYPNQAKGRYKKRDYQWSIYDGLQGFPKDII